MTKRTLVHVRKDLAAAFPDVTFSYGNAGRGYKRGHCVIWRGGPQADAVQAVAAPELGWGWKRKVWHYRREPTQAESDAMLAAREEERPLMEALAKELRLARREAGIAKAKATRARNVARNARLNRKWPSIVFDVTGDRVGWRGGPMESDVVALLGDVAVWQCSRILGPLDVVLAKQATLASAATVEAIRLQAVMAARHARRLAARRAKDVRIGAAMQRQVQASRQGKLCL